MGHCMLAVEHLNWHGFLLFNHLMLVLHNCTCPRLLLGHRDRQLFIHSASPFCSKNAARANIFKHWFLSYTLWLFRCIFLQCRCVRCYVQLTFSRQCIAVVLLIGTN
ncbi:hypothetical protein BS78_03G069200 [Paspalum vaginatum]|nr:hypothetical protein BS78_03G069200 [Paspalum vaginatum]